MNTCIPKLGPEIPSIQQQLCRQSEVGGVIISLFRQGGVQKCLKTLCRATGAQENPGGTMGGTHAYWTQIIPV